MSRGAPVEVPGHPGVTGQIGSRSWIRSTAGEVWTVVVAAGAGERFGAPKLLSSLGGRKVVEWSLVVARGLSTGVVLVVPGNVFRDQHSIEPAFPSGSHAGTGGVVEPQRTLLAPWATLDLAGLVDIVVPGGSTRATSVRRGLSAVPSSASVIVVHDAARPLAGEGLYVSVISAVAEGADAAVPGVGVVDTLKIVDTPEKAVTANGTASPVSGNVVSTLDRSRIVAVQTPQAFKASALIAAHGLGEDATDDAGLVEAIGGKVVVVPGDRWNLKITFPIDLAIAEAALAARSSEVSEPLSTHKGWSE